MRRLVVAYVVTLVAFCAVDFVWLGFLAADLYRDGIGHLLADSPRFGAAILFYLVYAAGLAHFAVLPALRAGGWPRATLQAAVFGFVAYATYDLTNLATLDGWPVSIVVADLAWGTFVSAVGATAGFFAARAVGGGAP